MGLAGNLEKEERRSLCKIRYLYSFVFIKWNKRERIPWCPYSVRSLIPIVKIKLYFSPKGKKRPWSWAVLGRTNSTEVPFWRWERDRSVGSYLPDLDGMDATVRCIQLDLLSFYTTWSILSPCDFTEIAKWFMEIHCTHITGTLMTVCIHDCEHQTKQMNGFFYCNDGLKCYL